MNNMELNDKDDKLFELYTLAELAYQNHFRNIVKDEDLFPPKWYEKNNYRKKIEIITEAIKTNTLIVNTETYLDFISCFERKRAKDI